jgi:hypothetical protein
MGRPRKETVLYFSHECEEDKLLFVLQECHGNDGYAFWFRLQQLLGRTPGHWLRFRTKSDWNYLSAYTHLRVDKCREIIELLAEEDAIDSERWAQYGVVWSENFVQGLADCYRKREADIPQPPEEFPRISGAEKGSQGGIPGADTGVSATDTGVSGAESTHTERNGSIRNGTGRKDMSADADFELFWDTYDHKEGRADALKAWKARRKEGRSVERIMEATTNYSGVCTLTGRWKQRAATFLGPGDHIDEWQTEGSAYQSAMQEDKRRTQRPGVFDQAAENAKALRELEEEQRQEDERAAK